MCRAECSFWKGVAFEAIGEKREAIDSYSEAVWTNPENWEAFHRRGQVVFGMSQNDLRVAQALQAECSEDESGMLLRYKEKVEHAITRISAAIKDFTEAIWLNPQFLPAYIDFFRLLITHTETTSNYFRPHHLFWANDYGETVRFLVDAVADTESDIVESLRAAFAASTTNGLPQQACCIVSELAKRAKASAAWYFILGVDQYERNKYEAAQASFQMALVSDPSAVAIRFGLATIYRTMHKTAQAEDAATSAKRLRCEICENRWRLRPSESCDGSIEARPTFRRLDHFGDTATQHIIATDLISGEERPSAVTVSQGEVYSLAFSRTGEHLAVGYGGGEIRIVRSDTGETVDCISLHEESPATAAFSPDHQFIAIGAGRDVSLLGLVGNERKHLGTLVHDADIVDLYVSQDGQRLGVEFAGR